MERLSIWLSQEAARWRRMVAVVLGRDDPSDRCCGDEHCEGHERMNGEMDGRTTDLGALARQTDERVRNAREALDRQSRTWHEGTQPLTVAKAKVEMLRRMAQEG